MHITNYILILFCVLLLKGCKDEKATNSTQNNVWKLVSMQSGMVAYSEEKETLTMSQTYTFNTDGTFSKTQTSEGKTLTGSGTYTTESVEDDGTYYILKYNQRNEIVGSCSGRDSEDLILRIDGKLQNSWRMCDGPLLVYEKQ